MTSGTLQSHTIPNSLVVDVRSTASQTVSAPTALLAALLVVLLAGLITSSVMAPAAPTPRISFSTVANPTIAHVSFTARNVGRTDHLILDARTSILDQTISPPTR